MREAIHRAPGTARSTVRHRPEPSGNPRKRPALGLPGLLPWLLATIGTGGPLIASGADAYVSRLGDRQAFERFVREGRDSPFGLDYVFVHSPGARNRDLVDTFCETVAIRWVNLAKLEWSAIEPRPPVAGRHRYQWRDMDEAVRAWQRNGIHIMVSMRFGSPWATAAKSDKEFVYLKGIVGKLALAAADYLPKPEHIPDLRQYVQNLVERYDGDGRDDMPGLLFPVLHYQVGNEYSNEVFWAGSVDEYGQLLHEVSSAARAACPDVRIILSGIGFREVYGFYDVGMDRRTAAYVSQYLSKVPANMRPFVERTDAFSRTSAAFCNDYDILDARWPNYGIVAKSRELLRDVGCPDRPIWSAEIYSGVPLMEPLVLPNWTLHAWPTPSRSSEYARILKNKNDPQFDEVNRWYRGMQAAQVVKICMVALDAGSRKLMMGWAVDAQHPLAVSTLSHHGLYSLTFERLWPAARTYDLTICKLDGLQRIERVRMPENIYVYRCLVQDGRQVLVAFCDDHLGQNHDEPTARTQAAIRMPAPSARITHLIRELDQTEPRIETLDVAGGLLRLELTEYPVFIEAVGRPRAE